MHGNQTVLLVYALLNMTAEDESGYVKIGKVIGYIIYYFY
jgi:hypothetical protein